MEFGEGKHVFIKGNITGNVDTPFRGIQTLESFVHIAIPKKNALF
jgi:hypothetical protein